MEWPKRLCCWLMSNSIAEPVSKPTAAEQISAYCKTLLRVRLLLVNISPLQTWPNVLLLMNADYQPATKHIRTLCCWWNNDYQPMTQTCYYEMPIISLLHKRVRTWNTNAEKRPAQFGYRKSRNSGTSTVATLAHGKSKNTYDVERNEEGITMANLWFKLINVVSACLYGS